MASVTLLDMVGGKVAIGHDVSNGRDLIHAVRSGFSTQSIDFVVETGRLTLAEIDHIVLPRKTLSHRRKIGTLTAEQSDRLVRVARILAAAEETFGSKEKAAKWLRRPTSALAGEPPLSLLDTTEGAAQVGALLGRIGHGIAA